MVTLVTGGAGFIGSHLVDVLLERGDRVVVVDDLSTGRRENLEGAINGGAELVVADITDANAMAGIVESNGPELIFHLAAQISVTRSIADPALDARVNVDGTISMLEAARRADTPRFVFASSGGTVYGEGAERKLPMTEDAACLPTVPYGKSKLAAEGCVTDHQRLHGIPGVSLRLGNVYGPRQDPDGEAGVIAIFCGRLLGGKVPTVYGGGTQTRDYVYVDDAVEAFVAAGASDATGVYNVGTGSGTSVLELLALLSGLAEVNAEPEMAPSRGEIQDISIDPALARETLGWQPRTSLDIGLARTLESFVNLRR